MSKIFEIADGFVDTLAEFESDRGDVSRGARI